MILLRGIFGESYARKIEQGIVSFRDILSTLLYPKYTGYRFSSYIEYRVRQLINMIIAPPSNFFLFDEAVQNDLLMIFNNTIPYIYMSYFHILNSNTINWINNFDDEVKFIYIEPQIDSVSNNFMARICWVEGWNIYLISMI